MRIVRATRAFFSAALLFVRRQPGAVIYVAFVAAIVIKILIAASLPPLPPEQRKAQMQAEAEDRARTEQQIAWRNAAREQTKELCATKSLCEKYGQARQDCAVAGDFRNCLQVKMGDKDYYQTYLCTNDGKVSGVVESDMPSALSCAASGL